MGGYPQRMGISCQDLIDLGRINPGDAGERFCMSTFACNTCCLLYTSQEVGYQVNFYICSEKNFNEEWLDTYYATCLLYTSGTKSLFTISPADGSYKVNFGEEEFENYFKDFLRPQLVEMLF